MGSNHEDAERAVNDAGAAGYWGVMSCSGTCSKHGSRKAGCGRTLRPIGSNCLDILSGELLDLRRSTTRYTRCACWGKLIEKNGGYVSVIGPTSVKRDTYDFKANRSNSIAALNEVGKTLTDIGAIGVLHQQTRACIETPGGTIQRDGQPRCKSRQAGSQCGLVAKGRSRSG